MLGSTLPSFDFHWNTSTDYSERSHLQSYLVVVHFCQSKADYEKADDLHWLGLSLPKSAKRLSSADIIGTAFGPGAGAGPFDHYLFEFYALDATLELQRDISLGRLQQVVAAHRISRTTWLDRTPILQ
jgi:hypothetical protein